MSDSATIQERDTELRTVGDEGAVLQSALKFTSWLETVGYWSHDPYDVWGTAYGKWARKIYYKKRMLGALFVGPLLVLDVLLPRLVRVFTKKCRYATSDAQLVLAFLNLHRVTGDDTWLSKAVDLGEELVEYSVPGYSGYCWGYPFDWQNNKGLWRKDTPFITCTPYCFEAFLALNEVTGEERYLEIAESIAKFVFEDLNETVTGPDSSAGSYSPIDHSQVINAGAYRAFVLLEAGVSVWADGMRSVERLRARLQGATEKRRAASLTDEEASE